MHGETWYKQNQAKTKISIYLIRDHVDSTLFFSDMQII